MRLIHALVAATLLLAACATPVIEPPGTETRPEQVDNALTRLAETGGRIADAIGQAPPATLSRTQIDENLILGAIATFRVALTGIELVVDNTSWLPRNSPRALAVQRGVRAVQRALNIAHAAQRAGNATNYRQALGDAARAITLTRNALNGG